MGKFTRRRKFEQRDERRYSVMKMLSIEEELKILIRGEGSLSGKHRTERRL